MNNVINFKEPSILKERFLRAKDLQKIFVGISPAVVTVWAKKGILKPYKIGGCKFFKESEVIKLIEGSKVWQE